MNNVCSKRWMNKVDLSGLFVVLFVVYALSFGEQLLPLICILYALFVIDNLIHFK